MSYRVRIITPHPLVAKCLVGQLSHSPELNGLVLPPKPVFPPFPQHSKKCIFVLDTPSFSLPLSKVARTLRVCHPASKLLVLVGPKESDKEILRLLYNGIEGIVRMGDSLEAELPQAVQELLSGNLWAPRKVLAEFVRQTNLLINQQFHSRLPLTARENQVLQFMIRRLSNKEVAGALKISERTVRFHVSNIFAKLQVADRSHLLTVFEKLKHRPAPGIG